MASNVGNMCSVDNNVAQQQILYLFKFHRWQGLHLPHLEMERDSKTIASLSVLCPFRRWGGHHDFEMEYFGQGGRNTDLSCVRVNLDAQGYANSIQSLYQIFIRSPAFLWMTMPGRIYRQLPTRWVFLPQHKKVSEWLESGESRPRQT